MRYTYEPHGKKVGYITRGEGVLVCRIETLDMTTAETGARLVAALNFVEDLAVHTEPNIKHKAGLRPVIIAALRIRDGAA